MQGGSGSNHSAINAWIEGNLTPEQRQEFEAHLASCSECQEIASAALKAKISETTRMRILAQTATPPAPATPEPPAGRRRPPLLILILVLAALVLAIGYALGWWAWDLAHH